MSRGSDRLRPVVLALAALLLAGWFSREISDTDFWWHLRTGQYLAERHTLPVPDPFAWTTASAPPAYPGEEQTRYFNLTHEWLAQLLMYLVYRVAGFSGVALARALMLTVFCGLAGAIAYRRTGHFYRAAACALAAGGVAAAFAQDRPYVATFLFLALTAAILELRPRWIWALPPLFVMWANCHGGFFLGWVVVGAWAIERRERRMWLAAAACVLASGLNPNGFNVLRTLAAYRESYMQTRLLEWAPARLWPPGLFSVLLAGGAAVLLWARRRVRVADWLIFGTFAAAALAASRNTILIGFYAPIVMASYLPAAKKRDYSAVLGWGGGLALAVGLAFGIAQGGFFRPRVNPWKWPAGAADFLAAHGVTQPLFNTYEYGGYLMWRLWPRERVFIDGRALSDSLFLDYARILYNHDATGGKSGEELLRRYGVEAIVMNGFEYVTGNLYLLAPALADPRRSEWRLVYSDAQAIVLMRHPPAGVEPLGSLEVLDHLEAECGLHIEHEPQYPRCARSLGQVFLKLGDAARARRWIGEYVRLKTEPDAEAEQAYARLLSAGR